MTGPKSRLARGEARQGKPISRAADMRLKSFIVTRCALCSGVKLRRRTSPSANRSARLSISTVSKDQARYPDHPPRRHLGRNTDHTPLFSATDQRPDRAPLESEIQATEHKRGSHMLLGR